MAAEPIALKKGKARNNPVANAYRSFQNFNALAWFDPKRPPSGPRTVLVGVEPPAHSTMSAPRFALPFTKKARTVTHPDGSTTEGVRAKSGFGTQVAAAPGWKHPSNQVLTSKYNIVTFLPRNLLEQFRRVANVFFLVLVILQFFPRFTTVNPGLSALPLIVVLTITALKDGYEDVKRHQSDRAINNIQVLALRGNWVNHNVTEGKSKGIKLPAWLMRAFGMGGASFVNEEVAAEEEREAAKKKGFWGSRKNKIHHKKDKRAGSTTASLSGDHSTGGDHSPTASGANTPRKSRFGSVKSTTDQQQQRDRSQTDASKKAPTVVEPLPPAVEDRLEGDFYEDSFPSSHLPEGAEKEKATGLHIPLVGGKHFDKPTWVKESWEDLKVGDFVRLSNNDSIPSDILICATSEEENVCYVETKNLDGETNLKVRSAIPELTHLRTSSAIAASKFEVDCEPADVNMFSFNATVRLLDGRLGKDGKALRSPATLNTMLLRGTVLRNTDWVIGVVVMTGWHTKIVMNSGGTPSKRGRVETQMDPMVFINLALLAVMCTMCAIVDHFLEVEYYPRGAPWLYGDNRPDDNPQINGLITFANGLIAFQNIVPISLYISIEFVRLVQAFYIWADDDIYYKTAHSKRRTMARSWNLSDDLGQIEYIFSDKTGTLTQNAMLFRQCSVNGKVYFGDEDVGASTTVVDGGSGAEPSGSSDAGTDSGKKQVKLADQVLAPFHDRVLNDDLLKPESPQAKALYDFFCNLALCHTVLAQEEDGHISYKAQSPDEAALVQAAADVGFVFVGRDRNILRIQTPSDHGTVEYELLNVIEFSSARKRMSVIVRRLHSDGTTDGLVLLSKGADNVIFERLAAGSDALKKKTDGHLEDFANEGLRTLCLAYKYLDDDVYEAWEREYHEAETAIDNREDLMEAVAEKLERDLILLGATAIEDKLQDGVPEAIADLKRAGLKIWVATGDKLETAIAIGKTASLLSPDMNLILIKGGAYGEDKSAYEQIRNALERFFDGSNLPGLMTNQPPGVEPTRASVDGLKDRQQRPQHKRQLTAVSGVSDIVGKDNGERPGGYGLIIDGASLRHAFAEQYTKELLLELAVRCRAVICCRTSPLQKALIVRLVKDGLGSMCLAIGDGANDVSMIQAADIGVGVAGEEGLQAVNSSDYAIGQFRFLKRLLLVHGHDSYMRNGTMIVNFFYKEIIGIGILFWYQFWCAYSATTVYEYTYLLFWNVFWTIAPVVFMGIFDRRLSDRVLMTIPELYRQNYFNIPRFATYMIDGIYQSFVIYIFILYTYDTTSVRDDGLTIDLYEFSTIMAIVAVITANMYHGLNTSNWNWWILFGVLLGPILITLYNVVYAAFAPGLIWTYVYGYNNYWWSSVQFYLTTVLGCVVSLAPRYLYVFFRTNFFPSDTDILRIVDKKEPNHDWVNDPHMPKQPEVGKPEPKDDDVGQPLSPRPSFQALERMRSSMSQTHDMSTGGNRTGAGRGFGFDQADNMLPSNIKRYTSRNSEHSSYKRQNRPRKGSVRVGNVELNPFLRTPEKSGRDRSSSLLRQSLFGSGKKGKDTSISDRLEPPEGQ